VVRKNKNKILIIDDDIEICRSFSEWLKDKKYLTEFVTKGTEGLEKIKQEDYDVIILDIKMPDIDGIEVLRQAKEIVPDIPIIILTGYASTESAVEAVRYGAYDYISKPANMHKLDIIIRRAIQQKILLVKNVKMVKELGVRNEQLSVYKDQLEKLVADTKDELKITKEQLLRSERLAALGEFAAGFCHEVSNPLAIISGTLEYLIKDNSNNTKVEIAFSELKSIAAEAERCRRSIERLRNFTNDVETSKPSSVNINLLLEEVVNFMKHQLERLKISVNKEFNPDIPEIIADRNRLKEVFINLVLNAQHAMPKGGTITFITKCHSDKKGIAIGIGDTGRSIPKEIIGRIFDPFFTTKVMGMGLGLPISQNIISKYGGSIDVRSKGGEGTTFTIKFPVGKEAGNEGPPARQASGAGKGPRQTSFRDRQETPPDKLPGQARDDEKEEYISN